MHLMGYIPCGDSCSTSNQSKEDNVNDRDIIRHAISHYTNYHSDSQCMSFEDDRFRLILFRPAICIDEEHDYYPNCIQECNITGSTPYDQLSPHSQFIYDFWEMPDDIIWMPFEPFSRKNSSF